MVPKNKNSLMINTRLMKITGLYYLLDSRSPKIFGHNVFKCMSIIQMSILSITLVKTFVIIIIFFLDDINTIMQYLLLILSDILTILKLYSIIVNSDTIWNCIQMTSIDYLSYKYHDKRILKDGQSKSKLYTILIIILWLNLIICWGLAPLFVTNFFFEVKIDNKISRYRFNILNILLPDTDQFFNDNFIIYYCMEYIILMLWCHGTMNFDILLLSTNITFKYQLKTIENSFSTFNISQNDVKNDHKTIAKHRKESESMIDFKSIIYDQQLIIKNMRNIYQIFKPVILSQLAFEFLSIILQSCLIMMNYFNNMSLISAMNLRLISGISTFIFHVYVICYLFDNVNQQKDSINFALYSSDWTQSNLQHQNLLLNAMWMNNAENLKLQLTQNKIVNFKMFTDFMRTTYSILSVLEKICAKKTIK